MPMVASPSPCPRILGPHKVNLAPSPVTDTVLDHLLDSLCNVASIRYAPTEREADLLEAHRVLMVGLIDEIGVYRSAGVGVMAGEEVIHMGPPSGRVPILMARLLRWLASTEAHPLIASSVFHYEFEYIHPFADGNVRMGRLWQSLILARWNPLFADLPVESLVHAHQDAYYDALRESTKQTDSAPFIALILRMIEAALRTATPQVSPRVGKLLQQFEGEMSREALQERLGLKDRQSFRARYLKPALDAGLIEMTRPDTPNSRSQGYRLTEAGQALAREQHRA